MKAQVLTVLELAKSLIKDESKWWDESIKLNYSDNTYCPIMAVGEYTVANGKSKFRVHAICVDILNTISKMMGYTCIVNLNASGSHSTVITMFDLAIQFVQDGLIQIKE